MLDFVANEQASPLRRLERTERVRILNACGLRLTGRQRQLLILRYEDDWTLVEIAAVFHVTKVAVHRMHARAIAVLHEELAARHIDTLDDI